MVYPAPGRPGDGDVLYEFGVTCGGLRFRVVVVRNVRWLAVVHGRTIILRDTGSHELNKAMARLAGKNSMV